MLLVPFLEPRPSNEGEGQASKYRKISTCPASRKLLAYMGKIKFSLEISKFALALQPEALVNTSGRMLFSSPAGVLKKKTYFSIKTCVVGTQKTVSMGHIF